ncbi:MAG: serine O-acetyltransferase EpsC [Hyphomicrobium sp.]
MPDDFGTGLDNEIEAGDRGLVPWDIEQIVGELRDARRRSARVISAANRRSPIPSPELLQQVVNRLYASLFPRHAGAVDHSEEGLAFFVGSTLSEALHLLVEQVRREHGFVDNARAAKERSPHSAEKIVNDFARELPKIYELLESDIRAAYDGDPSARSTEEVLLSFPGVKATIYHRIAHVLHSLGAPVVARIIAELAHSQTGIDIHPGAEIGGSFFIDHGTGVVIGETVIIGQRVRIYQAVTLGAKRFSVDEQGALVKGEPRHPIVEDDVVIYAGATILGRITIGRASSIGGNVWLTRSVPPFSTVVQAQAHSETFDHGAGI